MKPTLKQQLLALSLLASVAGVPLMAMAATFSDVQGNWASSAIQQLSTQGIIGGYPTGEFRPTAPITRAEFSTVLTKALNLQVRGQGNGQTGSVFTDVPANNWAAPAIEAVRSSGLVSGYPNQLFMPTKNISRAEAASVIVNASRMPLVSESEASQLLSRYNDASQVPAWARRHVATAIKNRLAAMDPAQGSQLMPTEPATRADVAAMTQNLRLALNLDNTAMAQNNSYNPYSNTQQQSYNNANGMNGNNTNATLNSGVTVVPASTKFTATLANSLDSETAKVGDAIMLTLDKALTSSNGQIVVPSGSTIKGKVSKVEAGGRAGKFGSVELTFNELITPDGQRAPLEAQIATEDGVLRGDTTKGRILKTLGGTALGAGAGAALGTALAPLSGGKVGKGAVYGSAVGAGLGAVASVGRKGKEVDLRTGDKLEIQLTEPLSLNGNASANPNGY